MVATASLLNIRYLKFYIWRNRYRYDVDFWIYQTSFTPSPISRDFVQYRDFSVYELAIISQRQMGPARNSVIENESKLVFEGDLIDRTRKNSEITTIMSHPLLSHCMPHFRMRNQGWRRQCPHAARRRCSRSYLNYDLLTYTDRCPNSEQTH